MTKYAHCFKVSSTFGCLHYIYSFIFTRLFTSVKKRHQLWTCVSLDFKKIKPTNKLIKLIKPISSFSLAYIKWPYIIILSVHIQDGCIILHLMLVPKTKRPPPPLNLKCFKLWCAAFSHENCTFSSWEQLRIIVIIIIIQSFFSRIFLSFSNKMNLLINRKQGQFINEKAAF